MEVFLSSLTKASLPGILAAALYVTLEEGREKTVQIRAGRINELKPHVGLEEARRAVEEVDALMIDSERYSIN
ncbi:hypothetical protein [Pelotomaculum propionicicum]|uniref:hypothetical protein n=1 Tax=Pelotomaculum propionicicum TaxID=258475 RepID=UPI001065000D|nr:hypothetical protein [Pelotomaculum propionicicum]